MALTQQELLSENSERLSIFHIVFYDHTDGFDHCTPYFIRAVRHWIFY